MARKKRKDEKVEDYQWVPPEFDEKSFLKKDIDGTKALIITAVTAVVFGFVTSIVGNALGIIVGLLIYVVGAVVLNYLLRYMKVNMANIDKKTTAGNLILYFLLALGMWILFINKPFL